MVTKGETRGGINKEFGTNLYTLLYINWVINRDLLTIKSRELYLEFYNNW